MRYTPLFFLMLWICNIQGSLNASQSVYITELDPDAYVHQKVNVVTGQYLEKTTEFTLDRGGVLRVERLYRPYQPLVLQLVAENLDGGEEFYPQQALLEFELGQAYSSTHLDRSEQVEEKMAKQLPSGNHLFLTLDKQRRLILIEMLDSTQTESLGWLRLEYCDQENDRMITLTSSHEKKVVYHLKKIGDDFLVVSITGSAIVPLNWHYQEKKIVIEKPEGRYLEIEFDDQKRVMALNEPHPQKGTPEKTYTFKYQDNLTEAVNALGVKTLYHYDGLMRLKRIEKFDFQQNLYRTERKYWQPPLHAPSRLLAKTVEDGEGRVLTYTRYRYAIDGKILEEVLYGTLTGKKEVVLQVDSQGELIAPCEEESSKKTYQYNAHGLVSVRTFGNESEIHYFYKPQTDRVIKKLIFLKGKLQRRLFHHFNAKAEYIRTVEDNGTGPDESDLTGVTERYTMDYAREDRADGTSLMTDVHKVYDPEAKEESIYAQYRQLYNRQGQLVRYESLDKDGTLSYSYQRRYHPMGMVVYEKDYFDQEYLYEYDLNGNLTQVEFPHEKRRIETKYDLRNYPVKTLEICEEQCHENTQSYDLLGRQTSYKNHDGEEANYEYDAFGNMIKITSPWISDEEGFSTFTHRYAYDVLGYQTQCERVGLNSFTQTNTVRGSPIKISYSDGTSESFEYDTEGYLTKHITVEGETLTYTFDEMGRFFSEEG